MANIRYYTPPTVDPDTLLRYTQQADGKIRFGYPNGKYVDVDANAVNAILMSLGMKNVFTQDLSDPQTRMGAIDQLLEDRWPR